MKRSCGLMLVLSLASIGGYFLLIRHYAPPDTETGLIAVLALLGGLSLVMLLGSVAALIRDAKHRSLIRASLAGRPFTDGKKAAVLGRIEPDSVPLCTSPFSGQECIGYEYKVARTTHTGGKQADTYRKSYCLGYGRTTRPSRGCC